MATGVIFYLVSIEIGSHSPHLFVQELPRVLLDVSFIQIGGQTHQTHLREAKVCELDVTHGGDQEAEIRHRKFRLNFV